MLVFADDGIYSGAPQIPFTIAEDNIFERKINLNADRGVSGISLKDILVAMKDNFVIEAVDVDRLQDEEIEKLERQVITFGKGLYKSTHGKKMLLFMTKLTDFGVRLNKMKMRTKRVKKSKSTLYSKEFGNELLKGSEEIRKQEEADD